MTDKEKMFSKNQKKNPPIERSESFVDRQWEITNQRRQKRKERSRNKVMMIRVLAGQVKKKSRWLLAMI